MVTLVWMLDRRLADKPTVTITNVSDTKHVDNG